MGPAAQRPVVALHDGFRRAGSFTTSEESTVVGHPNTCRYDNFDYRLDGGIKVSLHS